MNTAPLQGIKVIDFTAVQSGPSCTQMLAWFGAEVIKIERVGTGDVTRDELQFNPKLPSYYFLQLNSDKKSLSLDAKTPDGVKILTELLKTADVFVENLHPGAMDKLGFSWEVVHKLNPKCIYATLKGFPLGSKFANLKAFEPVAQCAGGAATTTGWYEGSTNFPTQSGAALGDSNTGMHLLIGILAALLQRQHTGEGCLVYQSMQNACLNLCRIKLRDQLNLEKLGYLVQYPQYPNGKFGDTVPRAGNIEGGGVLGWQYPCKNYKTNDNDYVYIIIQKKNKDAFEAFKAMGLDDMCTDPRFMTAAARDKNKEIIWHRISAWTIDKTQEECMAVLGKAGVPSSPVVTMREIAHDPENLANQTLVKINQGGEVGEFLTVACPCTFNNFTPNYGPCPELGGNNVEILKGLGYTDAQIEEMNNNGTLKPLKK